MTAKAKPLDRADGPQQPELAPAPRSRGPTLVHVFTVPLSLRFIDGQVPFFRDRGFDVHVITSPGPELDEFGEREGVPTIGIPMPRRITPLGDLVSVFRLWRAFRSLRPDVVFSHTPKGGLLGTLAAFLAGVPVRLYHINGLPFLTKHGAKRALLRLTERIACTFATRVIAVSHSMRRVAVGDGLCPEDKIAVLLGGTSNGVNVDRFAPASETDRARARARLGIPDGALVFGFIGRIVRDKGIVELVDAWQEVRTRLPEARLVLIGPREEEDPIPARTASAIDGDPTIISTGYERDPAPRYAAMDVVVLPTYREGFPNVPLEATSSRLPVVATRVPGCTDAVVDGETGLLVPPQDAAALAEALLRYGHDADLRKRHGEAGRERVLRDFRRQALWAAYESEYLRLHGAAASQGLLPGSDGGFGA